MKSLSYLKKLNNTNFRSDLILKTGAKIDSSLPFYTQDSSHTMTNHFITSSCIQYHVTPCPIIKFCKGTKAKARYQRSTAEAWAYAEFDTRDNSGHVMMNGMGYKRHWNGFIPVFAHHSSQIKKHINIILLQDVTGLNHDFCQKKLYEFYY